MQLRATRRSTQKFDPTDADVEQKEKQTQDRQHAVSSINHPLTRRTPRQYPTYVPYNSDLPPAAFPTLNSPHLKRVETQVFTTSADQSLRSPTVTPPYSPSLPSSEESPPPRSPTPQYEPDIHAKHRLPSSAPTMVQNKSWNWRDFYRPISMPEATDDLDFAMFQESSLPNIRPQRPFKTQARGDIRSTNQESRERLTPARVDLGATNDSDTALLQRNRGLVMKVDHTTEDEWYQVEMMTSDEEVPPPVKRHKAWGHKALRWKDIPVALRVDLVGSIVEQCKSKYDAMRKLRLSDAQMEDFERHEAIRADKQHAEDINMQIIQSSTMEHIRNGGLNGSKQVTASGYREMLNQSLFSTIDFDEDYFTATASDVDKARTYLSLCGLKATILEHWLDVDGHSISSLRSRTMSHGFPQEDFETMAHSPSLNKSLVLVPHASLGPSQLALIASMQAANTSGFPITLPKKSTLTQAAQSTDVVFNGIAISGLLTPGLTGAPQAPKEQALPVKRRVHGAPENLGSQISSPNISYGIDPAIARGHVYDAPIRSIDGLVQPRGTPSSTRSARLMVPENPPGPTPRYSSMDMTENLYSYSDTSGGPARLQANPQAYGVGESVSTAPVITPQRPALVPPNPSSTIRPSTPILGQLKSSSITARNADTGNAVQPTIQSITSDRAIPSQAPTQSSRSVAVDQTRPLSGPTASIQQDHSVSTTGIVSVSDTAISLLAQPITHSASTRSNHVPAIQGVSADQSPHAEQYSGIRHIRTSDPSRAITAPILRTSNPQAHGPPWQTNLPGTVRDKASYSQASDSDTLSHQHPLQTYTPSNQQAVVSFGIATYHQPGTLENSSHQHPPYTSNNSSYASWAHRRIHDMQSANRINAYGYPPTPHQLMQRDTFMPRKEEPSQSSEPPQFSRSTMDNMNVSATQFSTNPTTGKKTDTPQSDPQWPNDPSRQDAGPIRMPNNMNLVHQAHVSPHFKSTGPHPPTSNTNQSISSRNTSQEQSQTSATLPNSYTGARPRHRVAAPSMITSRSSHTSPQTGSNHSMMPINSLLDSNHATEVSLQDSVHVTKQPQPPSITNSGVQTRVNIPDIRQENHPVNVSVQSTTATLRIPPQINASNQGNGGTAPDIVCSDMSSNTQKQPKKRNIPTYTGTARPPPALTVESSGAPNEGTKRRNSSGTRTTNLSNTPQIDSTFAGQPARQPGAEKATVKPAAKKRKTKGQSAPLNNSRTAGTVFGSQQASKATNKNDIRPAHILQPSMSETNQVGETSKQLSEVEMTTVVPIPQDMENTEAGNTVFDPQSAVSTELVSQEKRLAMPSTSAATEVAPQDQEYTDPTVRTVPLPPRTPSGQFKVVKKKSANRNIQPPTNADPQFQAAVNTAPTSRIARLNSETVPDQPNPKTRTGRKSSRPPINEPSGGSQHETSAATTNFTTQSSDLTTTIKTKTKPKAATLKSQKTVASAAGARNATIPGQSTTRAQSKENEANATAKPAPRRPPKSTGPGGKSTGVAQSAVAVKGPSKEALANERAKPAAPRGRKRAV